MATLNLLALDTATPACSVALQWQGQQYRRWELAPAAHGDRILVMVETVLSEAGATLRALDAMAFGCGPGSFTGLRVCAGVTQGLAFAAQIPVVPVSNLAIMAQQARRRLGPGRWLVAMDARMGEVYWGIYSNDGQQNAVRWVGEDERVGRPATLAVPNGSDWIGVGTGWQLPSLREHGRAFVAHIEPDWLPDAVDVLPLAEQAYREGRAIRPADVHPTYLRNDVAKVKS